jgi:rhodanese-related sulfurtransferase
MSTTSPVERLLAEARAVLGPRPGPAELPALVAAGALVVDIRPESHRRDEGEIPGALAVERNVLEWRLDPLGAHRLEQLGSPEHVVVLVCDEGYASSLAAVVLRTLGLVNATDLDGGYRGWAASTDAASPSRMSASDTSTSSIPRVR